MTAHRIGKRTNTVVTVTRTWRFRVGVVGSFHAHSPVSVTVCGHLPGSSTRARKSGYPVGTCSMAITKGRSKASLSVQDVIALRVVLTPAAEAVALLGAQMGP